MCRNARMWKCADLHKLLTCWLNDNKLSNVTPRLWLTHWCIDVMHGDVTDAVALSHRGSSAIDNCCWLPRIKEEAIIVQPAVHWLETLIHLSQSPNVFQLNIQLSIIIYHGHIQLDWHCVQQNLFNTPYLRKCFMYYIYYVDTWINSARGLYFFNYLFVNEGLLRVAGSHVQCKCSNIQKWCQMGVAVITGSDMWLSNSGNSDDLEWPSRPLTYCKPFQM